MSNKLADIRTRLITAAVLGTKVQTYQPEALRWIHLHVVTTATAGNRQVVVTLYDTDGNALWDLNAGATQGASLTRHYSLIKGATREGSFTGTNEIVMPLGDLVLMPGQYLTVEDANAVDAADTFEIAYQADK